MKLILKAYPDNINFKGCSLITGFHGIGATGYWSVKYLVQKLEPKRVVVFDSDLTSPVTSTAQGKLVTPYEILKKDDLAIFKVETPPFKGAEVEFFRAFSEWVIKSGFKEVVLIGGLDSSLRYDNSNYRVAYTSAFKPKGELEKAKILEDEHLIVGPVATLLNYFEIKDFPAYAILSYASPERVDPRATAEAINFLSRFYGFKIDIKPLIKGAEALESEISVEQKKVTKSADSMYT